MVPRSLWNNLVMAVCRKFPAANMDMRRWYRLERLLRTMCKYVPVCVN